MPTPLFVFRLPEDSAKKLRELALLYNGGNPSALLRDMVGAVVSGEPKRVSEFLQLLMHRMGEQLLIDFNAKVEAKKAAAVKRKRKGRRRATR